ncbi:MAG TPA: hypothetical protein VHP14_08050 [Anaerolineales bacterium]|nr:hypothetical protein [Anaerolineales bacterium]
MSMDPYAVWTAGRSTYAPRPVNRPLAWVAGDRILLDDVSPFGLHRWVIARKDECPDQVSFLLEAFKRAGNADVRWRLFWKDDGYWYLWIVWKER